MTRYFNTVQLRPTLRHKQPWQSVHFSTLSTRLPIKFGIKMAHTTADLLFTRYHVCAAFSFLDMQIAEKRNYISRLFPVILQKILMCTCL